MLKKYSLIFLIFVFSFVVFSCKKNDKKDDNKVEIVLEHSEIGEANITDIKDYNEEYMKTLVLDTLKEFLTIEYSPEGVYTAYEKFFSKKYKEVLKNKRNIKNADEYVESYPSLDFEFDIKVEKVYDVWFDSNKAFIDIDSLVYDRVDKRTTKSRQTFVMEYEDNRWVIAH